ncbi:regulator of G-protein signaling rgs-2-like isoform X1 [Hydractinia symbiolongicarpus]|uniref:regulator of G-protein signaling rgs-2-like isoform X1 n=2 Tax=Hydractinia symbiolongicarpus TaxID=13093 RepID=UPI00254FA17E|nr:regulator of G-protein signaling rgs-2-like isoform X1 [Hydractinia symbiolongicarpus]
MNGTASSPVISMGGGASSVAPEEFDNTRRQKSYCCGCFTVNRKSSPEDDDRRTLREEAKSWSNNFERMLKHPVGQKSFQEFLQGQFSDENLRFWIEAEKYSNLDDDSRQKKAKTLYDEFVSTISPCEVSLDAKHKNEIESNIKDAPKNLFKSAQGYIYSLMYRDCFPRFLKSKSYRRLCR